MDRHSDTWLTRDYPVLHAVAAMLDQSPGSPVSGYDLPSRLGISELETARALAALEGEYIDRITEGAMDGAPDLGYIRRMTPAARRIVGMWPTGESITDQLLASLDERIDQETEPEQKSRLVKVRDAIGGTTRDLFVGVAGSVLSRAITGA